MPIGACTALVCRNSQHPQPPAISVALRALSVSCSPMGGRCSVSAVHQSAGGLLLSLVLVRRGLPPQMGAQNTPPLCDDRSEVVYHVRVAHIVHHFTLVSAQDLRVLCSHLLYSVLLPVCTAFTTHLPPIIQRSVGTYIVGGCGCCLLPSVNRVFTAVNSRSHL